MTINLNDNLVEKLLSVLQDQPQARALNAISRCNAIVTAFCKPGSTEKFTIQVAEETPDLQTTINSLLKGILKENLKAFEQAIPKV